MGPPDTAASRYGIRRVTYAYSPRISVLKDVSFELEAGVVRGLLGENGSGKSTLIKLLTGVIRPQTGRLHLDGEEIHLSSPAAALERGVGVVHQDYNLFPDMTVAQNVVGVGTSIPRRRWSRTVDRARIESELNDMLRSLGIALDANALVRTLGPAERKLLEIVRALRTRPRFLILDEPTASLEPQASESVLALLDRLRQRGLGLCFVSHRLNEVLQIADDVRVLRDGAMVGSARVSELTEERLARMIVGEQEEKRREQQAIRNASASDGQRGTTLRMRGLKLAAGCRPVDLDLARGEILGLTGLIGSGASTVVRMLGGAEAMRGTVEVDGRRVRITSPRQARALGIGFIPEDRKALGAIPDMSIALNISIASLSDVSRAGIVDHAAMRERGALYARRLDVRAPSVDVAASTLSGGNLQKVLLGKWLASGCGVLAIEEPTHGIDIGGKAQVHALLRAFVADGGSIVVALSEADEALELCDRIAVFRHGELTGISSAAELTMSSLTLMGASDRLDRVVQGAGAP